MTLPTSAIAIGSKYVIRWRGRHVLNPSNFALVVTFLAIGPQLADPLEFWWAPMTPWLVLALAVVLLDAALTFHNVWPTPWIAPTMEMSVELGVLLLSVVAWVGWRGSISRGLRFVLALLLLLLVIGRYAEVTAPAGAKPAND